MTNEDHFQWVDDLVKRWPVFLGILGLVGWLTGMQFKQEALGAELKSINDGYPGLIQKVDDMSKKLDAVLEAQGYEVKYVALKKGIKP